MEKEYDFSKGTRGKFYSPNAQYNLPLYLEPDVMNYFTEQAKAKGVELSSIVNELLKKNIAIIESFK